MQRLFRVRTGVLLVGAAALVFVVLPVIQSMAADEPAVDRTRIRIGTYDNRAIAIAYAASAYNPVKEKMAAYQKAKDAGNSDEVAKLETWGKDHQRMLHFQGFGHVPVSDLLAPVAQQFAEVAKTHQLSAIVMDCDFAADGVEVVDVTDKLVELFEPSEQTRKQIASMKNVEPLSLVALADLPAEH